MKYEKPEIMLLGSAIETVRGSNVKNGNASDSADTQAITSAYEADE